ncbi:MAG: hypothetical protein ABI405_04725 [Parafilimonas sp.]
MELIINFDDIRDPSKRELLLSTLKLMEIKFQIFTRPETLVEFNFELGTANT